MKSLIAALALLLAGATACAQAPSRPEVLQVVRVIANWPSATPQEVEEKLAIPLEKELARLPAILAMNITSADASLRADIRFTTTSPGDAEVAAVSQAMERVRAAWPSGSNVMSVSVQPSRWAEWEPAR